MQPNEEEIRADREIKRRLEYVEQRNDNQSMRR
jgi:hypothetical protein